MAISDYQKIVDDLSVLHRDASRLDGWYKDLAQEFIDVGECSLALDTIAYAYLRNGKSMPADMFEIFERLAVEMEMEGDLEFKGVARVRAQNST